MRPTAEPLMPARDEDSEDTLAAAKLAPSDWGAWLDSLPGGEMDQEQAMELARAAADEARGALLRERSRRQ